MTACWESLVAEWAPEKAWFLGTIWGAGNIYSHPPSGSYRVGLVGPASLTHRWLKLLSESKAPKPLKRAASTFQAYLDSKGLVGWFQAQYAFSGPKTDKLLWPTDLPKSLTSHFLRGLWDSCGTLGLREYDRPGNPEFKLVYSSRSVSFVEGVAFEVSRLLPEADCPGSFPSRGLQYVSYSSTTALKVATLLYEDSPDHIRNEDRFLAYKKARDLRIQIAEAKCVCGRSVTHEGLCQKCWWDKRPKTTGPGTSCACGKPIKAKGLCVSCYTKQRRRVGPVERQSTGTCKCGAPAYQKGRCDSCNTEAYWKAKAIAAGRSDV